MTNFTIRTWAIQSDKIWKSLEEPHNKTFHPRLTKPRLNLKNLKPKKAKVARGRSPQCERGSVSEATSCTSMWMWLIQLLKDWAVISIIALIHIPWELTENVDKKVQLPFLSCLIKFLYLDPHQKLMRSILDWDSFTIRALWKSVQRILRNPTEKPTKPTCTHCVLCVYISFMTVRVYSSPL